VGSLTGRFRRHEGLFDPGQRVANVVMVLSMAVLTATGLALTMLHGGPVFGLLAKVHLVATIVVTPVLAGHVLIALGILPGYRGVWRSMHLGGRVPQESSGRVWPGWTERRLRGSNGQGPAEHGPTDHGPEDRRSGPRSRRAMELR
jgi:formate dehydrogenase subunit gamma